VWTIQEKKRGLVTKTLFFFIIILLVLGSSSRVAFEAVFFHILG